MLAFLLTPLLIMMSLFAFAQPAQAARVSGVTQVGAGYTQVFTQPNVAPVTATYSFTAGTAASSPATAGFPTKSGNAGMYADPIPAGTAVAQIDTTPGTCTGGTGNFECANRGSVTVSFSSPVDNPILNIAGLGAAQGENRWGATGTITSVPAGATMAVKPGAVNLQVVNSGKKFQTTSTRPNTACNAAPAGTNGAAGCGSLQIVGTGLTSITLTMGIRGNRGVAGAITSNEQWTLLVSLEDAPVASLEMKKTADVTEVTEAGQTINYTFTATNVGNVPLKDVAPVENDFSGTGNLGDITPASVATLNPGASAEFTAAYTVTQADIDAGGVENTATATGTPPAGVNLLPPTPAEVVVPATPNPKLTVQKTGTPSAPDAFVVGQEITYTFKVSNTGNVTMTDVVPVEGAFSGTGALSAITPAAVTLAPGENQDFTAQYTLTQADVDAGNVKNSATAGGIPPTGPPITTPPSEFEIPVIPAPSLTVVKSSDVDSVTKAGDEIVYSFLVTNTGNVTINDVKPTEESFSGTGTMAAISPASATLAPSESKTFTSLYTVTQADIDAGGVQNVAKATGTPPGGSTLPPTPPSEHEVPATPAPKLSVVKTAAPAAPSAFTVGEEITYSFLVTNTGNVTMTDVAPTEEAFSGTGTLSPITPAAVTLAPGEDQVFSATYVLTQADVDASKVTNTARASGVPPTGPPNEAPPSLFEIPVIPNPSLSIEKTADVASVAKAGDKITYSFVVTNTGNTTIQDAKPVEGTFTGTGTFGDITPDAKTLAAGADQTFTAEYTVTQEDIDAGGVDNSATATGTPPAGSDLTPPPLSEVTVPATPAPKLTIVKSSDVTEVTSAGEVITYSFMVSNTGNVTITDAKPVEGEFTGSGTLGAITPASVSLAPGSSETFTAEYTVTQADIDAGGVDNTATATGTPPGGGTVPSPPPSEVNIPAVVDPALELSKTADLTDSTRYQVGEVVTYIFTATNTGNVTLTDVTPVEGDFSGTGTLGAITPAPVTLVPGDSATFTAEYTLTQADVDAGEVTNTATASGVPPTGPPVDSPPANNLIPTPPIPDLAIVKTADLTEITAAGEVVNYTFVVSNTGNVTLTDVVPVETDFSGTGKIGAFTPASATIAPGADETFTATYTVTQADVDSGKLTNAATATGTPPGNGDLPPIPPSEVIVPVTPAPGLTVVKTADMTEVTAAGDVVTYSFVVTNTGNVSIADAKPVEGDFTGTGDLGGITPASANLAPGEDATFTAEYTVTQTDINAGGVMNTATATGTPPGGSELPPVPKTEVEVPATQTPGLTVVKTADTAEVNAAGDVITYSFVVKNTGNVTITDAKPVEGNFTGTGVIGVITPASATLAPGNSATFTAEYVVTQADIDAGGVTNAATPTGTPPGDGTIPPTPPSEITVPATPSPKLEIEKSSDLTNVINYKAGEVVTYLFKVTNTGNVTLTDVAPVEGEFSGTGTIGAITPENVDLAPSEVAMFSAEYTLTQADIDAGTVTNSAKASGVPPTGPPIDSPPSETELPTPPSPGLSIVKSADLTKIDNVGDVVTYSFVVTNTGNVTIADAQPVEGDFSGTGTMSDFTPEKATLAPAASETFTATYTVTQADIDAGDLTNTATATGTPPGAGELPPTPPSQVVVPVVPAPSLAIVKTADLAEFHTVGEIITYSFEITNTGNVTVADAKPVEGDFTGTGTMGAFAPESVTLASGDAATFTAKYTVTQADVDAGGIDNSATATGTPSGTVPLPPTPPSAVNVPAPANPSLTVVKSADTDEVTAAGEVITYSFLITNTGNVTVDDVAPVESAFTGTGELGAFTPAKASLAPGTERIFTAKYTVTQADIDAGGVDNTATATGTPPGGTALPPVPESSVVVPATPAPALEVVKSASQMSAEQYQVGEVVTYSFVVTNTGNVTMRDVSPVEGDFSGSGTLGAITPGPVASLAPGAQAKFSAQYTLTQADIDAGSVTNTATPSGVPPTGPPVAGPPSKVEVPTPAVPKLSVVKSADVQQVTVAGEKVTYSFLLTNTGNVTLTDAVPVEGDFSGTGQLGQITPEAATLLPGENATFTAEYIVSQADIDAGGVKNTATATATPPNGSKLPPTPKSTVELPAPAAPALALVKSADVDKIRAVGDKVTYSFKVTNTGNVTMTDVAPVEGEFSGTGKLGAITPASVASLAPGEDTTFTATYTVTRQDLSGKKLTNQATATGTPPQGGKIDSPPSTVKVASVDLPGPTLAITGSQVATGAIALTLLLILSGTVLMMRRRVTRS